MATSEIRLNVVTGARRPWATGTELLVTAIDGRQKPVIRDSVKIDSAGTIRLTNLEVRDNLDDRYTVLVSAKGHADAGFTPIRIQENQTHDLHLMMLRRDAQFTFDSFATIKADQKLHAFLCGKNPANPEADYDELRDSNEPALACLLNIAAALQQITLTPFDTLDSNPLSSFKSLESAQQDRVFAWVDARLVEQLRMTSEAEGSGVSRFVRAPAGLHEGATVSYKQTDFGEGNVQLSFHEIEPKPKAINGVNCILVDADIDYFKDAGAHLLLEVFPNTLKQWRHGKNSAASLTDPRKVYGMRWIAGKRFGRPFEPLYTLS